MSIAEKEPFWLRWWPWGKKKKTMEPDEQIRGFLQNLVQGIVPSQEQLAVILKEPSEKRSQWWLAAVRAVPTSTGKMVNGMGPSSSPAWRLARILRLEIYWQEVMSNLPTAPKERVIETIGPMPLPEVLPLLEAALISGAPSVSLAAADYLAKRPEPRVTDFFIEVLHRPDGGPWTDRAARGLAMRRAFDGQSVWSQLIAMTTQAEEEIRSRAWEVMASFGPPAEQEEVGDLDRALKKSLSDASPLVRARAAESAGLLARGALIPALMEAMSDENERVRAEAARSLGRLAALDLLAAEIKKDVRNILTQGLEDPDYRVSGCARQALHYITES
ncbi:HEAT repeat domain-containing protein [Heliobacterium chlorum]|uniref:HEAT repeat domain-containing protein n=1 Tax=Heliobacterium chlorum TaxID=2698 RepID=A0ABR7T3Y0_HELCL|nr:HEAT repeat domain-containing protein [Heliobacterium chlorum]MBC9785478.1 HEAT repeat domain-containing protein [Heliobacterium chlorum]